MWKWIWEFKSPDQFVCEEDVTQKKVEKVFFPQILQIQKNFWVGKRFQKNKLMPHAGRPIPTTKSTISFVWFIMTASKTIEGKHICNSSDERRNFNLSLYLRNQRSTIRKIFWPPYFCPLHCTNIKSFNKHKPHNGTRNKLSEEKSICKHVKQDLQRTVPAVIFRILILWSKLMKTLLWYTFSWKQNDQKIY